MKMFQRLRKNKELEITIKLNYSEFHDLRSIINISKIQIPKHIDDRQVEKFINLLRSLD